MTAIEIVMVATIVMAVGTILLLWLGRGDVVEIVCAAVLAVIGVAGLVLVVLLGLGVVR